MTLRHFTIFLAVCEEMNMTKAAAKLHMTQPSVSQAIRELEDYYNTPLFERLGRKLYLSESGKRLQPYVSQILTLNRFIDSMMHGHNENFPIRLGASLTIGETLLVQVMKDITALAPQQEIVSEIHNTDELQAMLLNDTLDIALIEGQITASTLVADPFMIDELILVVPRAWQSMVPSTITTEELPSIKLFLREEGSGTRSLFEGLIKERHIPLQIVGNYNNTASLKQAVIAGFGGTVISRRLVTEELQAGLMTHIPITDLSLQRLFSIVYHKDKYINKSLQRVIDVAHALTNK